MKSIGELMRNLGIFTKVGVLGIGLVTAFFWFDSWDHGMSMADNKELSLTEKEVWKGITRYCVAGNDATGIYSCGLFADKLVEVRADITIQQAGQSTTAQVSGNEAAQMHRAAEAAAPILDHLKETFGDSEGKGA